MKTPPLAPVGPATNWISLSRWIGIIVGAALLGGCASPIVVPPLQDDVSETRLPGKFVWHDLLTPDPDGARQFYQELLGWEFLPVAEGRYLVIQSEGRRIGGVVDSGKAGLQVPNAYWLCGVSSPDVDATTGAIEENGGKTLRGPADLPDRGRVAIVLDAEGAPLQLIHSTSGDPADTDPVLHQWIWHELISNAPDRAAAFYTEVLGYTEDQVETEAGRTYRILTAMDQPRAGVVENPFADTSPIWIPYVLVSDPAATAAKAAELGGRIIVAPQPELRDGTVAMILDPMGAPLALQKYGEGR